jgi:hypothetical protein
LTAAGVAPWEYEVYHGGVAALAGLSCHVHTSEFEMLRHPNCSSFELTPGADLSNKWPVKWRSMSVQERKAHFHQRAAAPPPHLRALLPLASFTARCNEAIDGAQTSRLPLALYVGSPMTAVHASFTHDPELRRRVAYCCAMSGAWDGGQNLLGCCFNNAVDYAASQAVCQPGYFPNGRLLLVPTETCKLGPFTLTPETLAAMPLGPQSSSLKAGLKNVLVSDVQQWTDLKRGVAQPLFDVLTVWPLTCLVGHAAIVPADVCFGCNRFAVGTLYENLGVTLRNATQASEGAASPSSPADDVSTELLPTSLAGVRGRLGPNSVFAPGGIYATERVFSEGCAAAFAGLFEGFMAGP